MRAIQRSHVEASGSRVSRAYLLLVLAQAAHSIEETATELYAVFPPAGFVSSLVSQDPATGFVMVNVALVGFGLWCWARPVRRRWPSARWVASAWALVEMANGCGHLWLAASRGGYFPGAASSPLLLGAAAWVVRALRPCPLATRAT